MDSEEVMTLGEVARYLKLAERTVLRMAHRGEIPCGKVANQWRFLRPMIDDWLTSRMRVIPQNDLARLIESGADVVPLSRIVREDFIVMDIRPGTREEVLEQMVVPLVHRGIIRDAAEFVGRLMRRERIVSTAVGRGVAIPHVRNPQENPGGGPVLVIGICADGTDFGSLDGQKTHLFFLLCADSEVVHLRVLAKFNHILRQPEVVSRLMRARDKEEIVRILIQIDQQMSLER